MLFLDNVTKRYKMRDGSWHTVLDGITALIRPGDAVGILGRNGAGKSTLIRTMARVEYPSSGRVEHRMSVSWPLGFGVGLQNTMSGADNVRFISRLYGRDPDEIMDFVEDFAELGDYMRMPTKTYSSGMMGRLQFGMSLAIDFDCYLIDEATATGDSRFVERARQMLAARTRDRAIIMVSHQANTIRSYCRTAAVLNEGKLTFYEDMDEAFAAYEAL